MQRKLKVAVIGVVGVPARYGGLETMAHHFVLDLADQYNLTVYNSTQKYEPEERTPTWNGAKIVYLPFSANGAQSVIYDIIAMLHAIFRNDVLVVLGVSGCIILPLLKTLFRKKRILVNIDGLEWRRPKWGRFAKWYLKLAEGLSVKHADRIIADNQAIKQYVHDVYGRAQADMIAYGGDHAQSAKILPEDQVAYPFLNGKYAVKACRVEPENNIEMILEGFSRFKDIAVVILGNWRDSAFGVNLRKKYSKYDHIYMLDFIRDRRVLNMLRSNAYVYLHGHSAGGTNPSLVEAMNLKLPTIAFDCVFNRESTENKALFFKTADELLHLLEQLTDKQREELGETMQEIAQRRYTWKVITGQYAQSIEASIEQPELISVPVPG